MPNGTDRRVDLPPDVFAEAAGRVRDPKRLESTATIDPTQIASRWRARVYNSAGQTLVSGTPLNLSWDSETFDPQGMHDPASNPSRITIPSVGKVSGAWVVLGVVQVAAGANAGTLTMELRRNGVAFATYIRAFLANETFTLTLGDLISDPTLGSYFELRCSQSSGASCTVASGSTNTYLTVVHNW